MGARVMTGVPRDPWAQLDWRTSARIAIGRAGASLPTREVLSFALAHARARDAVRARFDRAELGARLESLGLLVTNVESQAGNRSVYLRRPDLGRRLKPASRDRLAKSAGEPACDLALMIGDGLSANAVAANAPPMIEALLPFAESLGLTLGPVVIAEGARVALGDEVGEILGARLIAVLIGERPGLSAADSLSIYLTYAPQIGRTDAERNCISNIRPGGLASTAAAANLAWLIEAARAMRMTGIGLKDQSGIGQAASLALAHSNPNASS